MSCCKVCSSFHKRKLVREQNSNLRAAFEKMETKPVYLDNSVINDENWIYSCDVEKSITMKNTDQRKFGKQN